MDTDRRAMFTDTLIYFNIVSSFFRTMSSMCLSDGLPPGGEYLITGRYIVYGELKYPKLP